MESHKKTSSKNKGYYVKMKLMHNKHGTRPQQEKNNSFHKYFKWILWLSLSLYFFTSYLVNNNNNNNDHHHHHHNNHKPTHIIKSLSQSQSFSTNKTTSNIKNLKIFIYDLPPKYNTVWLTNPRCKTHLFASEVAIHEALSTSNYRTFDPYDADFFFVPVYVSCNFSTVNGFPAIGHARSLISSAVHLISSDFPFWNRSRGSDHVFVASHDFGSCFHTLEDVAIKDGVPEIMKKSIVLQTFGVTYDHPCQKVEHVVIPPFVSPGSIYNTLKNFPVDGRRDIWVFFRGKMEVHPKNVSGRFYSKKVRTVIWQKLNGDRRFYLQRRRFAGYQSEIARSVFCLCPLGWAPWSPRLVESVALGCVPVIIADGIRLPFPSAVKWSEISVTVAERDVGRLAEILENVAASNLSVIQRKLWDPWTRKALLFSNRVQEGDATWQVLHSLSEKLGRSYRSSRVSRQLNFDT
ncbi:hypothetical protein RYX36_036823 [Vicia faba]